MRHARWMLIGLLAALCFAPGSRLWAQGAAPAGAAAKEQCDKALATLRAGDASLADKQMACRTLAVVGDASAVPVLAALLADEKLAHMARFALEPIPDPAVDVAFRAALGQLQGKLLVGVVNSIGVRRDAQAVDALAKLLVGGDAEVTLAAGASLGRLGDPAAIKVLTAALTHGTPAVRAAAADGCLRGAATLLAAGKASEAAALCDQVRGSDVPPQVRLGALRGAIVARGPAGVPLLLETLRSDDVPTFRVALRVASELPGAEVTKALADEVAKLPAAKQAVTLAALGNRGDVAALPAVLALAKAGDLAVRVAALRVLPQLPSPAAVPVLLEAATGADADVAKAAQASLAALPGKDVEAALTAALAQPDVPARRVALEVLGQRRVAAAIPALFAATTDGDETIRLAALKALEDVAGVDDLPRLADLLLKAKAQPEADAAEKTLAAVCARLNAGDACADKLLPVLAQAPVPAKRSLLRVLRSAGGAKALEAVRAAVKDADKDVQDAAVRALCEWPTLDAAPDLIALIKSPPTPTHRILALRGYVRLSRDRDLPAARRLALLREALDLAQRDDEKKLVLGALGSLPDAAALALVLPGLESAGVKDEAAAAALAIGEKLVANKPAAVADAMRKVVAAAPGGDLATRAQILLNRVAPKRKGPPGKLVIKKAVYGDLPTGTTADVTKKVADLVVDGMVSVEATNTNFGDPVDGVVKKLRVDYTYNGKDGSKTVAENQTLTIPAAGD